MKTQRKCPNCHTWNADNDNCSECNTLLSPEKIEIAREKIREEKRKTPPTPFDLFIVK